ncbi:TetR/AcrR family transcriptional regulator [Bosea sp. (in: a-proteobacteria)]|jgi:AcrR family transcriptional regulator|uniref:TetR/AcrR family transcriptional regulator n=1 Tax=Bosea sp. (in: a-proteobacteria) TaxID=1871050 RepID=UPI002DDCAF49|nr:TetR/AcrR family transcriptional regulator [Bosea sp. (in: a-proteobacteria)]HEV2511605.1 TetR/AcrR family transcriptional regulator [Bosea sp. (in: a-proteobacteria)]
MARPKEFDRQEALDAAIGVFREHGYEGTSAGMLIDAMKIGRQSLYDTFGDKWRLYCEALQSYATAETSAHLAALKGGESALGGIRGMIGRVVATARIPCLGVGSICEFGETRHELVEIRAAAGHVLHVAMVEKVRAAQADGEVATELDADDAAMFLTASIAGIRIAGRSGAPETRLHALGALALRALG